MRRHQCAEAGMLSALQTRWPLALSTEQIGAGSYPPTLSAHNSSHSARREGGPFDTATEPSHPFTNGEG